jgi:acyl carrier protein
VSELRVAIQEFLVDQTYQRVDAEDVLRSDNLMKDDVIDSLVLMLLVAFLQDRFHLTLSADEVTSKNFRSVDSIVELVEARLGAGR